MTTTPVLDTSSTAELIDVAMALEPDTDPLMALIDAMPPYLHSLARAVPMFDPSWRGIWERESEIGRKLSTSDKAENLGVHVDGINCHGWNRPDWSRAILDAAGAFDVAMVRELLRAGVRADQLYVCECGAMWDLGSYALHAYMMRAQMFPKAANLWADKCAHIVALSVRAGGPCWLSVWLEPSAAPVLASRHLAGVSLKGSESWADLLVELDLTDGADVETGVLALLEKFGALGGGLPVWPGRTEARARFDVCLDTFLAVDELDALGLGVEVDTCET